MELQEIWEKAVSFHGCGCPGLAIGVRATAFVMEHFHLSPESEMPIVCTAESFACSIDAIQAVLGCTIGNGKLRVQNKRKLAFRFCNEQTNQSVYLVLKRWVTDRPNMTRRVLDMPIDKLFAITYGEEIPQKAPICILSSACRMRTPRKTCEQVVYIDYQNLSEELYSVGYDRDW